MSRAEQIAAPRAATMTLTMLAIYAAGSAWSCGAPKQIRTPERPGQTLVVLLPDAATGVVGHATVTSPSGSADLSAARDSTTASINEPLASVTVMSEAEVRRIFGAALAALPPAPSRFTLFFRFESDEPTVESRALIPDVVKAVKGRPVPEVAVIGHTDTTGTTASNLELGLRRANMVRSLLIAAGLDASFIELASHGESELLVPTADEVLEPRNRRVEISVR